MAVEKQAETNTETKTTIVKPVLRFNNEPHALESALKAKDAPEIKSVGIVRLDNGWVSCMITTKGEKVISIEPGEPNMKKIAIDEAKVTFVDNFMSDF